MNIRDNDNLFLNKIWRNKYLKNFIFKQIKSIGKLETVTVGNKIKLTDHMSYDFYSVYNIGWMLKNGYKEMLKEKLIEDILSDGGCKNGLSFTKYKIINREVSFFYNKIEPTIKLVFQKLNQPQDIEILELLFNGYYCEFLDLDLIDLCCDYGNLVALKLIHEKHTQYLQSNKHLAFKPTKLMYFSNSLTKSIHNGHVEIVNYFYSKQIYTLEQFQQEFLLSILLENNRCFEMMFFLLGEVGIDLKTVLLRETLSTHDLLKCPLPLFNKIVSILNIPLNEQQLSVCLTDFKLFSSSFQEIQDFLTKIKYIMTNYYRNAKCNSEVTGIISSLQKDQITTKQELIVYYIKFFKAIQSECGFLSIYSIIDLNKIIIEYCMIYKDDVDMAERNIENWVNEHSSIRCIYLKSFIYASSTILEKCITKNKSILNLKGYFINLQGNQFFSKIIENNLDGSEYDIKIQFVKSLISIGIEQLSYVLVQILNDENFEIVKLIFNHLVETKEIQDRNHHKRILMASIESDSSLIFEFLWENREHMEYEWNQMGGILEYIGRNCAIQICKFIKSKDLIDFIEKSDLSRIMDTSASIISNKSLEFMKYLNENGFNCTGQAYIKSLENQNYSIFLYLVNHRSDSFNLLSINNVVENHYHQVQYCLDLGVPMSRLQMNSIQFENLKTTSNSIQQLIENYQYDRLFDIYFTIKPGETFPLILTSEQKSKDSIIPTCLKYGYISVLKKLLEFDKYKYLEECKTQIGIAVQFNQQHLIHYIIGQFENQSKIYYDINWFRNKQILFMESNFQLNKLILSKLKFNEAILKIQDENLYPNRHSYLSTICQYASSQLLSIHIQDVSNLKKNLSLIIKNILEPLLIEALTQLIPVVKSMVIYYIFNQFPSSFSISKYKKKYSTANPKLIELFNFIENNK